MDRIHLLFPIETIVRELDFRLVLAAQAAHRGNRVLIGTTKHTYRLARQVRHGVYVGKHIFTQVAPHDDPPIYHEAKARGTTVIHLSEEGAVFMGTEDEWRSDLLGMFDPHLLAPEDYLCTWGDFQREVYRAVEPRVRDHVRTTGHPRFDLYRPRWRALYRDDARAIRARFGRFVLVNTNFAFAINPLGIGHTFSRAWWYYPEDPVARVRHVARWSKVARTMPAFIELVHEASVRWPDVNFVVRPHPSDDAAYLRTVLAGVPNIHVVREGPVTPWLMACHLMVHEGCTTGIEAHLLGRPVVNYKPVPGTENDCYLPNVFGTRVETKAEAFRVFEEWLARPAPDALEADVPAPDTVPTRARALLHNLEAEGMPLLLATIREAERSLAGRRPAGPSRIRVGLDEALRQAIEHGKTPLRRASLRRRRFAVDAAARFPGFDPAAIHARMNLICRILGKRVDVRVHSPSLFEVTSDAPQPAD
jgi:surface carbohydrate biosynthesis protein